VDRARDRGGDNKYVEEGHEKRSKVNISESGVKGQAKAKGRERTAERHTLGVDAGGDGKNFNIGWGKQ